MLAPGQRLLFRVTSLWKGTDDQVLQLRVGLGEIRQGLDICRYVSQRILDRHTTERGCCVGIESSIWYVLPRLA